MATAVMSPVPAPMVGGLNESCNAAIGAALERAGWDAFADRAYLFRFRPGGMMSNTHEWCRHGVVPFQQKLAFIPQKALPWVAAQVMQGKVTMVNSADDTRDAPQEREEMEAEGIHSLLLVPVVAPVGGAKPLGFVGFDACRPSRRWGAADAASLRTVALQLAAITELQDSLSRAREPAEWAQRTLGVALAQQRGPAAVLDAVLRHRTRPASPRLLTATPCEEVMRRARAEFAERRWSVTPPAVWGLDAAVQEEFVAMCKRTWAQMLPDIAPYTRFRDVGYARYRYYKGDVRPLRHKAFFQVDPAANVLLNSAPRPFNRVPDEVRESPVLHSILRTLLEGVWSGELGDEVHINVHPVRVRNFHEGEIHRSLHATLEGTHVDSTERVAVMLIERHNVRVGEPKTSLYRAECPIGKRRDIPEDEAEIGPLRVVEHQLAEPLEAITFDDQCFKHDATDFHPTEEGERCWRCVMLVMARRPVHLPSPLDGQHIDGCTPRSECAEPPEAAEPPPLNFL